MTSVVSANRCIATFKNLGFEHLMEENTMGRILIFWKAGLNTTILDAFDQGILCHVNNGIQKFFVGFIYGRNKAHERRLLWSKLRLWSS